MKYKYITLSFILLLIPWQTVLNDKVTAAEIKSAVELEVGTLSYDAKQKSIDVPFKITNSDTNSKSLMLSQVNISLLAPESHSVSNRKGKSTVAVQDPVRTSQVKLEQPLVSNNPVSTTMQLVVGPLVPEHPVPGSGYGIDQASAVLPRHGNAFSHSRLQPVR